MKELTAVIVDSEKSSRILLRNLLDKLNPELQILAECSNLVEAIEVIDQVSPQVVFLDIQMNNYVGYEIINLFNKINFEIIFISAYKEFATKAFELCAIDYLVKPIKGSRLTKAIKKLYCKIETDNKLAEYQSYLDQKKGNTANKLIIPEIGNRRIIDTTNIIAIEADGSYTWIYLNNERKISTSKNLKYYDKSLGKRSPFFRSHRSWIINLDFLKQFNRSENTLYLDKDLVAKISRSNYSSLDALIS